LKMPGKDVSQVTGEVSRGFGQLPIKFAHTTCEVRGKCRKMRENAGKLLEQTEHRCVRKDPAHGDH